MDLPAAIRRLTERPVRVVVTHGHLDHAGGMGFFEEVGMHPADWPAARAVTLAERAAYLRTMMSAAHGLYSLAETDLRTFDAAPRLVPLREGDRIRLGGRDVLVLETPGHTAGGLSFLDPRERLLFSGDACWSTILLALAGNTDRVRTTCSAVAASAEKIVRLQGEFDRHYYGHVAEAAERDVLPLDPRVPAEVARTCRAIASGELRGRWRAEGDFCGEHLEVRSGGVTVQYFPWQAR